jgi:hypothetical protein
MPPTADFGLMILFEASELSENARRFLKSLSALEVAGVWFVPSGSDPNLLFLALQKHLSDAERNKGVAVIRVLRHESHSSIQGFLTLYDWFQPLR